MLADLGTLLARPEVVGVLGGDPPLTLQEGQVLAQVGEMLGIPSGVGDEDVDRVGHGEENSLSQAN